MLTVQVLVNIHSMHGWVNPKGGWGTKNLGGAGGGGFQSKFHNSVIASFQNTVIPVYSGHLRVREKVSAITRCPLYRGFFKNVLNGLRGVFID